MVSNSTRWRIALCSAAVVLIAERVAIEAYRQMIAQSGATDPTTTHMLIGSMAMEEEHADDMRDLLA